MIQIKTIEQLKDKGCTIKQATRIATSRKSFAVFTADKLHLVNDLDRLIYDKLGADEWQEVDIYQIN
jgi:hypothetical protein